VKRALSTVLRTVDPILQVCGGNAGALVRAAGSYNGLGGWKAGKCGVVEWYMVLPPVPSSVQHVLVDRVYRIDNVEGCLNVLRSTAQVPQH
jgi:hypothetical protein